MNRGQYRIEDEDAEAMFRNTAALRELLERAVTRMGSPGKLAQRLEITSSHVSRLRQGTCRLSVEVLLRLADLLDEDGIEIVRVCGHARIAERLDQLRRGSPQRPRTQLYDAIDRLSEADRQLVAGFVHRLLGDAPPSPKLPPPDPQTRSWR